MTNSVISPLRYPGSKRYFAAYIAQALEVNDLRPSLYIEPFIGGESAGLYLIQRNLIDKGISIDPGPWITNFERKVFWDTDWQLDQIEKAPVKLKDSESIRQRKPISRRR